MRLTNITSGSILIDNIDVKKIYAKTGILAVNFTEVLSLLSVKVYDLIKLYADLANGDSSIAYKILSELGLTDKILKSKKLHELSAGQIKAVYTAIALSMKAKHVLLDEPFKQLDPAQKHVFDKISCKIRWNNNFEYMKLGFLENLLDGKYSLCLKVFFTVPSLSKIYLRRDFP